MAEIIYDCPRCGVKKTSFDINGQNFIGKDSWRTILELYSICRHCHKGTIFIVKQINSNRDITKLIQNSGNVNDLIEITKYVNIRENSTDKPPEFLPKDINEVFEEGIICKSVACFNASATMFRLCLDKATKELLPDDNIHGLNEKIKSKRLELNLSQEALADKCGLDRTYVSLIERSKRNPSYLSLIKLCDGLEINIKELLE